MKKIGLFILLTAFFSLSGQAQGLKGLIKKAKTAVENKDGLSLSQEDIGKGLKQALDIGVDDAVSFLSAEDGFYKSAYKVLLPKEAQSIMNKLKVVPGFKNVEEKMLEKINRAAEDAASSAKPIFVKAIKGMSFDDALNILKGDKDAATRFLEKSTYDELYSAFMPEILADHVTTQALGGMFSLVEKKEEDIRGNKSLRTNDLLKKVFSKQDK